MRYVEIHATTYGHSDRVGGLITPEPTPAFSIHALHESLYNRAPESARGLSYMFKKAIDEEIPTKDGIQEMGEFAKGLEQRFGDQPAYRRGLIHTLPLMARLDVRAGHTLTRGMERPYDRRMTGAMQTVARSLVRSRHATAAYTQSDEITLVWSPAETDESPLGRYAFSGRIEKWLSTLAGEASAMMMREWIAYDLPGIPHFDCRLMQGSGEELAQVLRWRRADAFRNSILSCGQTWIGRRKIHGLGNRALLQAILEGYHDEWVGLDVTTRLGTPMVRAVVERELEADELESIPEKHRPLPGTTLVTRTAVKTVGFKELVKTISKIG